MFYNPYFKRKENAMKLNKKFFGYWMLLLLVSIVLLNGCKGSELVSKWRDKDIVIDASDSEWQDARQYYNEKTQTTVGLYNDDTDLYMCLTTLDTEIQTAVVTQGFIIWLNGKGSKAKELGIRFPVVEQMGPGGQGAPGGQAAPSGVGLQSVLPGGQGATGGPGGQGMPAGGVVSLSELKIMTSEKDEGTTLKREEAAQKGISARITNRDNRLVYEIKIPLNKTDKTPYAVVPSAKNNIGVGFMIYSKYRGRSASGISGFGGSMSDMSSGSGGGMGGGGGAPGGGGGGMDSRDSGFSMRDFSSMSNIFSFFSMSDDDASGMSNDDFFSMSNDDVSVINAQGGGAPPGGGGGMGGGMDDMGGSGGSMGGSMGGSSPSLAIEVWFNVILASK
jgi:hypothetical protein